MAFNKNQVHILDDDVRIPEKLTNLLKSDNYVLLIKGGPGTGKTILALSILLSLHQKKKSTYISTRVSPSKLFKHHNWLEKFFEISKKQKYQDESEYVTDLAVFVDARLYESGTLYERISNELIDSRQPVIIIDSLDAIESFSDKETLGNNAKILQTWGERARAKIIITVEDPNDSTFDFIADGIVELKEEYFNEKKIRKIVLSKLRGIKIERSSYFFTLNKGFFRSFEPYNASDYENSSQSAVLSPEKENLKGLVDESFFSTVHNELDRALRGDVLQSRIIDLNIDPNLSLGVIVRLMSRIVAKFTLANNPVLFQGFDKFDSNFLIKETKNIFPDATKEGLIRIVVPQTMNEKITESTNSDTTYQFNKNKLEYIQNNLMKLKKEFPDKPLINIMGFDISDIFYNMEDTTNAKKSFVELIKTNTTFSLLLSRYLGVENNIIKKSEMCGRLLLIAGTLFFLSITPMSQLFAIIPNDLRDHDNIRFEQVV